MQGLVVPSSMRLNVLGKIHQGHQGITKCRERAKAGVWWPGLSRQIEDVVTSSHKYIKRRVNKPEPLISSPVPDRPWQVLGTDLFELQSIDYLLVVDYFSKYVEIAPLLTQYTRDCAFRQCPSVQFWRVPQVFQRLELQTCYQQSSVPKV